MRGIFIFFSLVLLLVLKGSANEHRGLFFQSKDVSLENRTGLDLTWKGPIKIETSFSIEFEISFRAQEERFGYILQLNERNGNHHLELIYNVDGNFPDLFIVFDKMETGLQMAFTKDEIELLNRWYKLRLDINTISKEVSMTFNGRTVSDTINLSSSSKLDWIFGVVKRYGFDNDEVPPMSVRNIRFFDQNGLKYYWPLDYTNGTTSRDSVQGKTAAIINPDWVEVQHQNWQHLRTFEFTEMPQVAFNKNSESFYFLERGKGVIKFDLNKPAVTNLEYKSGNPLFEDAQQIFFDKDNNLRTFTDYKSIVPSFNETESTWDNSYDTLAYLPKYWHHNSLLHPVDSAFVAVAGYGFFTYFNTFRKLNDKTKKWEELQFKGDLFEPRYLAALGQSQYDKNVYYLFGGLGNKTGKQILGKEYFYDLYKIDFEAGYVMKVWEGIKIGDDDYTPVNSMIVNDKDNCFYTLCFSHHNNETSLQLLKADLNKADYRFIGSKIPYHFYDIKSFADIYKWESQNKLLALTIHEASERKYILNIYSLYYPPSETKLSKATSIADEEFSLKYLFFVIPALILAGLVIFLKRKKGIKVVTTKPQVDLVLNNSNAVETDGKGRILTFGGFQVFNKKGKDLTFRFSPTLKELFLLILLNTIDGNKGISSKNIQDYLWPDKPNGKAKNNRGVNIKKLRLILEDIGNISISYDGSYWRINLGDDIFCDIDYIKNYYSDNFDITKVGEFNKMMFILKQGKFLNNIENEWLDVIKDEISGRIVSRLEEVCELLDIRKNEKELLGISDVLFTFDELNETALRFKCTILSNQGKHSLAKEIYDHYIILYKNIYDIEFDQSFKTVVNSKLTT